MSIEDVPDFSSLFDVDTLFLLLEGRTFLSLEDDDGVLLLLLEVNNMLFFSLEQAGELFLPLEDD